MQKVSIIIPIYNVSKYLKKCMDCVVNQTLKDIEIICVNDGSTDNSLDIVNEYAQNDSRIVVIDKKNAGLGAAYNSGLDIAKGEYVGFVEPDDYIELNMYEDLYNCSCEEIDYVKSDHYVLKNDNALKAHAYSKYKNGIYENAKIHELILNHISHWSGLYKREFLEKYKIRFAETSGASFQDLGFIVQIYALANKVYITNNAYYYYRVYENQSSIDNKKNVLKHRQWVYDQYLYGLNVAAKYFNTLSKEKLNHFVYLLYKRLLINCERRNKGKNFKHMKDFSLLLNRKDIISAYDESLFSCEDKIIYNLIKNHPYFAYFYIKFSVVKKIRKVLFIIKLMKV